MPTNTGTGRDRLGISGVSTRLQLADVRVRACPPAASTAMGKRKERDKERYAARKANNPYFLIDRAAHAREWRAKEKEEEEELLSPPPADGAAPPDESTPPTCEAPPLEWWELPDWQPEKKWTGRPWLYGGLYSNKRPPTAQEKVENRAENLRKGMVMYQVVSKSGCVNFQRFRKARLYGKPYTPRERVEIMEAMAQHDAVDIHWPSGQVPKMLAPDPPPETPSPVKPPFDEECHSCHAPMNSAKRVRFARMSRGLFEGDGTVNEVEFGTF